MGPEPTVAEALPRSPRPALVLATLGLVFVGAVAGFLGYATQGLTPWTAGLAAMIMLLLLVSIIWGRRDRQTRLLQLKLCFSAGVVVVLLGLIEGGSRLAGFRPAADPPRRGFWVEDAELGFACRPNARFRYLAAGGWIDGSTDAVGYRPTLAGTDAPVILCLGDSTTFSTEAADDQTWPEAAARQLARRGKPHRLVNRGVPGYSGVQCLLALKRALDDPELARSVRGVVFLACNNDPLENFDGRALPRPILRPTSTGFEVVREPFHGILVPRSPASWLQDHSALAAALRDLRLDRGPAGYRSGAQQVLQGSRENLQRFEAEPRLRDGMRFTLAQLQAECARHGLPLFVAFFPYPVWEDDGPAGQEVRELLGLAPAALAEDRRRYHWACDQLRQMTEAVGGQYVELRGCLNGMGYRDYAANPYDWHYGPPALERIGQAIADQLAPRLP